jgi:hypothetical protein
LPQINRLTAMLIRGDAETSVIDFSPAMMACCSREGSLWKLAWTLAPRSR